MVVAKNCKGRYFMVVPSAAVDIKYPSLAEALYKASSLDDARLIYIEDLRSTENLIHLQYAAKLSQCRKMLSPQKLKQLERDFIGYKEHLRTWSKKTNVQMCLQRRQKDFLGLNSKIRLYLNTGKNLSKIKDMLGFRIVIKTGHPDDATSIAHCYDVLNETIRFFVRERKCFLLEAEPRSGKPITKAFAEKHHVFIPEKSIILHGFENNVKDYVLNPKHNGYQSLHLLFSTPADVIFEVQIRTASMDIIAEYGPCKHSSHKADKYEDIDLGYIDFTKINIPGFSVLPSGELYDKIGLQQAIDPFNSL